MEDAWGDTLNQKMTTRGMQKMDGGAVDIQFVKDYLDQNFKNRITLNDLVSTFFINKYYLMSLFKERYGSSITAYLNQVRVTYIKQQLRFTEKTVEEISGELGIEATYLSRLFKKVEGIAPSEYRKGWRGK